MPNADAIELEILKVALRRAGADCRDQDITTAEHDPLRAGSEVSGLILARHRTAWAVYRYDRGEVANIAFHAALRTAVDDYLVRMAGVGITAQDRRDWEAANGCRSDMFGTTPEQPIELC